MGSGSGDSGANRPGAGRNSIFAAGMPRAALGEADESEGEAGEQSAFAQGRAGIVRAGGSEAAAASRVQRDEGGRQGALVEPDEPARDEGGKTHQGLAKITHGRSAWCRRG